MARNPRLPSAPKPVPLQRIFTQKEQYDNNFIQTSLAGGRSRCSTTCQCTAASRSGAGRPLCPGRRHQSADTHQRDCPRCLGRGREGGQEPAKARREPQPQWQLHRHGHGDEPSLQPQRFDDHPLCHGGRRGEQRLATHAPLGQRPRGTGHAGHLCRRCPHGRNTHGRAGGEGGTARRGEEPPGGEVSPGWALPGTVQTEQPT